MIESLRRLSKGEAVSLAQARALMASILDGQARPEQVGALLALLHFLPPSADLLAGFAMELGRHHRPVAVPESLRERLVDVCGTGGDGSGTFNVSTTVAFIAAGAGLPIAKHGNRAVSSRSGSFDALEALGVAFTDDPGEAARSLERESLAFLYAPAYHPAFRQIAPIRKLLGFRTAFNALGPLLNPAGVRRQLIGVYSAALVAPMAEALALLGATSAMVAHGEDGMDEISLCAPTRIARLRDGKIEAYLLAPEDIGLRRCEPAALAGGEPQANAQILEAILAGERGPRADLACLNAGAALVVGDMAADMREGFALAREAQRAGKGLAVLRGLQQAAASARQGVAK